MTTAQPFALLRQRLGGQAVEARTIVDSSGYYGHMLISRWPIQCHRLHDVSFQHLEPRFVIAAEVATPAGAIQMLSTHLGLRMRERSWQASQLANVVAGLCGPVVAIGDFNEWNWRGVVDRALAPLLPARTRQRTYPARRPAFALDRIYCRPASMLGANWTDPASREASDHVVLIAEIDPPRQS